MKFFFRIFFLTGLTAVILPLRGGAREAEGGKGKEGSQLPIRALLVTGGASHDYSVRKEILVQGIGERITRPIDWTVRLQGEGASDVLIPVFEEANWAEGYDIVVHDYCFPRVRDDAYVDRILAPHRAGLPAVLVHGTMLSFRSLDEEWSDFCGAKSSGHGKPLDFSVEAIPGDNPLVAGMGTWKIPAGELYEISALVPGATALTRSLNAEGKEVVTSWTHLYGPAKTRVFASTLGNETTSLLTPAYLDLLAKGFLWALDALDGGAFIPVEADKSFVPKISKLRSTISPRPGFNLSGRGTASAMSSAAGGHSGAERAIDGDPETFWEAESAGPNSWQVDLGVSREIGALLLLWKDVGPKRCQVESSLDSLTWRLLFEGDEVGSDPLTLGFDPQPMRYLRVTIPETRPGEVPALREFAAYAAMAEMPAAFPDFRTINGSTRVKLATVRSPGTGVEMRVAPDWHASPLNLLPEGRTVVRLVPTAAGKALVLCAEKSHGERSVLLLSADEGGTLSSHELLGGLAPGTEVSWDGTSLYTLDGLEWNVVRDTKGDGHFDDRRRIGQIFTPTARRPEAGVSFRSLQAGPDGWFYAIATTAEKLRGFDARHNPVLLPAHALIRFRGDGNDFRVVAALPLAFDDFLFGSEAAIFLSRAHAPSRVDEPGLVPLPPLPNRRMGESPESFWPPGPDRETRFEQLDGFIDRDRLHGKFAGEPIEVIAQIRGLTSLGADGERIWVSLQEKGREYLTLFTPVSMPRPPGVAWNLLAKRALLPQLASPNRAVRTEAIFEILRRRDQPVKELEKALQSGPPPRAIEGILATLSASGEVDALDGLLAAAASPDPFTQALAFRHLGDHPEIKNHGVFAEIFNTTEPQVVTGILSAMASTGASLPGLERHLLNHVAASGTELAATARAFLQARGAVTVCFESLEQSGDSAVWPAAFSVLEGIHRTKVVERILDLLEKTESSEFRSRGLEALTGLYYKNPVAREAWAGTRDVDLFLKASLRDDRVNREKLLREMEAAGIPRSDPEMLLQLGKSDLALEAYVIAAFDSDKLKLPEKARPWVESLFRSPARDPDLRGKALGLLVRDAAAMEYRRGFNAVTGFINSGPASEGEQHLIRRWLARDDHPAESSSLIEKTRTTDPDQSRLAWITLADLSQRSSLDPQTTLALQARLEEVCEGPEIGIMSLLDSLGWASDRWADQVITRIAVAGGDSWRVQVLASARQRLSREEKEEGSKSLEAGEIASLFETLALLPTSLALGEQLFRAHSCGACHNIHGEGPTLAPDLATAVRKLSRVELIHAVLSPTSQGRAAGSVTCFELTGGRRISAHEEGRNREQIHLRDRAGNPFSLPLDRLERESPQEGADFCAAAASTLTARECAVLVAYLVSLGG